MSAPERLDEIRAKLDEQDFDWDYPFDVAADDLLTEVDRLTRQRDEWQARHAALRAGVERARRNRTTLTDVLMCIADVLDLDDAHERTDPAP